MKDKLGLFEKISTPLDGCFELQPKVRGDRRGGFVKTFHAAAFAEKMSCAVCISRYRPPITPNLPTAYAEI